MTDYVYDQNCEKIKGRKWGRKRMLSVTVLKTVFKLIIYYRESQVMQNIFQIYLGITTKTSKRSEARNSLGLSKK